MENYSSTPKIEIVEVFRFLAALSIVFVHIPIVAVGNFGVDIFFVISGFVMMVATHKNYSSFFTKRLIRILPTYYLFTVGVFLISFLAPSLLNYTTANWLHLIKSLLFVPFDKNGAGHYPILFLGWTLNYEMYFYALFAIALKISHKYRASITTFFIFIVWLSLNNIKSYPLSIYGSAIVFEFVLGMLIYSLLFEKKFLQIVIMILTLIICMYFLKDYMFRDRLFKYGFPSFLIILIAVKFAGSVKMPNLLLQLGGASYMLYLTHPYLIQLFVRFTNWFYGNAFEQFLALVLSLFVTIFSSLVFYKYLETPTRNYLRRKLL